MGTFGWFLDTTDIITWLKIAQRAHQIFVYFLWWYTLNIPDDLPICTGFIRREPIDSLSALPLGSFTIFFAGLAIYVIWETLKH